MVDQRAVRLGIGVQVHALVPAVRGPDQVLVHALRHERHDRRYQLHKRDQTLVQGGVGGQLVLVRIALPETPPAATDVPVGQVLDEALGPSRGGLRPVARIGENPWALKGLGFGANCQQEGKSAPIKCRLSASLFIYRNQRQKHVGGPQPG